MRRILTSVFSRQSSVFSEIIADGWWLSAESPCTNSLQPRGCCGQRQRLSGHINEKVASLEAIVLVALVIGSAPDRSHVNLARVLGHFRRLATLLFYVCFDHLRGHAGGELAVFATFEQHADDELGIAARSDSNEPGIVLVIGLAEIAQLRFESVADGLRAAGFAAEIDALQMRAAGGAFRRSDLCHGVGDQFPILRIDGNAHFVLWRRGRLDAGRKIGGKGYVRPMQQTIAGNASNRAGQLNGSRRDCALSDADGDRFPGIPLLLYV